MGAGGGTRARRFVALGVAAALSVGAVGVTAASGATGKAGPQVKGVGIGSKEALAQDDVRPGDRSARTSSASAPVRCA